MKARLLGILLGVALVGGTAVMIGQSGGTVSTATMKKEDAAHASGDLGQPILTRRIDSRATSAGTSGDWATFDTNANGEAYTHDTDVLAKLPALGTAGTASTNVITVQGIASMTPVITVGSGTAGTPAGGILTIQGATSMTPILATVTGAVTTSGTVTEASASAMAADLNELTAAPVAKTLTPLVKEVAVSGTGVPLVASETFARKAYLTAKKTAGANTGLVYIGSSTVDVAGPQQNQLAPGDSIVIDPGPGCKIDLATIYIDCAAGNTDGVSGWYVAP
jgi:hypothetical protein